MSLVLTLEPSREHMVSRVTELGCLHGDVRVPCRLEGCRTECARPRRFGPYSSQSCTGGSCRQRKVSENTCPCGIKKFRSPVIRPGCAELSSELPVLRGILS